MSEFISVNIPEDSADLPPMDERTCTECGAPLPPTSGPGRKPTKCSDCRARKTSGTRASATPRGTTKTVNEALGTMDGIYGLVEVALMVVSPRAADAWNERRTEAQARNKAAFESSKNLAASVARWGQNSGTATFVLAQVYLAAPSIVIVSSDVRARKRERVAATPVETVTDDNVSDIASARHDDRFSHFL